MEATEPACAGSGMMPIRLVTNGLWPVSTPTTGPMVRFPNVHPAIANVELRAEDRGESYSGALGKTKKFTVGAAVLATQIAELFDSVSVALNTADPVQYDEVCAY